MAIRTIPVVGRPTDPPAALRKIAVEEHFMDPALVDPYYGDSFSAEVAQDDSSYGGFTSEFAKTVEARLHDLHEARIEEMDAAGIDLAILSHTIGGVEGIPDAPEAIRTATRVNDFLAGEIAASNGRFAGFATLPFQDVDAAVRELGRAVRELGMVGVMVNGFTDLAGDKLYLDEPRFDPVWAALKELDVPLYIHPRLPARAVQDAMYRGHPELVGAAWGFAPETATHVLRLVYGGVFDRHPEAKLIIGHLGETLPFFAGRIQRAFEYNPYTAHPPAPAGLPLGQHLGYHQRQLQRPGPDHRLAHRRRRPHPVRQRLPLRHVHRRGALDRAGTDQRERPPQDLLRQRCGALRPAAREEVRGAEPPGVPRARPRPATLPRTLPEGSGAAVAPTRLSAQRTQTRYPNGDLSGRVWD